MTFLCVGCRSATRQAGTQPAYLLNGLLLFLNRLTLGQCGAEQLHELIDLPCQSAHQRKPRLEAQEEGPGNTRQVATHNTRRRPQKREQQHEKHNSHGPHVWGERSSPRGVLPLRNSEKKSGDDWFGGCGVAVVAIFARSRGGRMGGPPQVVTKMQALDGPPLTPGVAATRFKEFELVEANTTGQSHRRNIMYTFVHFFAACG
jgi:hypothetical protein